MSCGWPPSGVTVIRPETMCTASARDGDTVQRTLRAERWPDDRQVVRGVIDGGRPEPAQPQAGHDRHQPVKPLAHHGDLMPGTANRDADASQPAHLGEFRAAGQHDLPRRDRPRARLHQ
jgi:hypothetical protein